MRKKFIFTLCLLLGIAGAVQAQQSDSYVRRELVSAPVDFFVPHWFVGFQLGGAYDVGEASFDELISPALQLSAGYQYNPWLSTRLAVSGFQARNKYAYPEHSYEWNFVQPTLDAMIDLTTLATGWQPDRTFGIYAFAGLGANYTFNNDEAEEASKRFGVDFQKLWYDNRWNFVARAGLGAKFNISDNLAITAEVGGSMLPDHFNSKIGKNDNRDWHLNALAGLTFTLGKDKGATDAIYREIVQQPVVVPETFVDVPIEKISFNINIYFLINQSIIRPIEVPKLQKLLEYLEQHPRAFIRLSGYADRDTGTPEINMRLSRERAQVVSNYLNNAGIEEWRIRRFAKGDLVQPFDIPEDNRVCICFVYDPDDPKYANE